MEKCYNRLRAKSTRKEAETLYANPPADRCCPVLGPADDPFVCKVPSAGRDRLPGGGRADRSLRAGPAGDPRPRF